VTCVYDLIVFTTSFAVYSKGYLLVSFGHYARDSGHFDGCFLVTLGVFLCREKLVFIVTGVLLPHFPGVRWALRFRGSGYGSGSEVGSRWLEKDINSRRQSQWSVFVLVFFVYRDQCVFCDKGS
jgi:hypothetical protein